MSLQLILWELKVLYAMKTKLNSEGRELDYDDSKRLEHLKNDLDNIKANKEPSEADKKFAATLDTEDIPF